MPIKRCGYLLSEDAIKIWTSNLGGGLPTPERDHPAYYIQQINRTFATYPDKPEYLAYYFTQIFSIDTVSLPSTDGKEETMYFFVKVEGNNDYKYPKKWMEQDLDRQLKGLLEVFFQAELSPWFEKVYND